MGFYTHIYNDVSSAHQRYNFLQKLRLGTWYSIEDVYQIIWACAVWFACFRGGPASRLRCSHLKAGRRRQRFDFVCELAEHSHSKEPEFKMFNFCVPSDMLPVQMRFTHNRLKKKKKKRHLDRTDIAQPRSLFCPNSSSVFCKRKE